MVDTAFHAAHVLAEAKVAVDVEHGECEPFADINGLLLASAVLLKLRHEPADVRLHHGLLLEKRAVREGAVQRAPDGDRVLVTGERNGLLAEQHFVEVPWVLGEVCPTSAVFLVSIYVGPCLRVDVRERPRGDAHNLAVFIVRFFQRILARAKKREDGQGNVGGGEVERAWVRCQWMEVDVINQFGRNGKDTLGNKTWLAQSNYMLAGAKTKLEKKPNTSERKYTTIDLVVKSR